MTVQPEEVAAAVQQVLDSQIRPRIRSHVGDVTISSVSADGDVRLAFLGACVSCPAKAATAALGVLPFIEDIDGVRSVSVEGLWISPHAQRRWKALAQGSLQYRRGNTDESHAVEIQRKEAKKTAECSS